MMDSLDWLTLCGGIPSLSLIPLGMLYKNKYYISDECLTCLDEINEKINCEDSRTRPLRRALIFMDILNKDLIPILIHIKDQPSIFNSAIKLLVWLTVPVGVLVSVETQNPNPTPKFIVHELTQFLYNAKESFLENPKAIRVLFDHLSCLLANQPLSMHDCDSVSHALLLIRNILHAPERPSQTLQSTDAPIQPGTNNSQAPPHKSHENSIYVCSQQKRLLWNLFAQGLDRLLINLLTSPHKDLWIMTIVQLIALFYKDQNVENMQKLLGNWINDSGSDISADGDGDESNTSQRSHTGPNCSSSSFPTSSSSDPTNDSSDSDQTKDSVLNNDTSAETIIPEIMPMESVCIYDENESITANEITVCQRTETSDTKKGEYILTPSNQKSKKMLSKRSRTMNHHHMKMKASIQYVPSDDDISQMLKEFTFDFLLNGYNTLVVELYQQLLRQESLPWLDKSHFLWLITYFLRFASKLKLDIKHFKDIFKIDILCYLIWEGVQLTEEFETALNQQPPVDLKPGQRRLHLSVTAILEYLQALETYTGDDSFNSDIGSSRNSNEYENIYKLRSCLPAIHDLRQLFLIRLRHLKPSIQGRRYLCDVITTNHVLLLMLEQIAGQSYYGASFDLGQHLKQFCSRAILDQYGTALEDFKINGSFVNDSIMTVLHHVGVDLDRADLLFEPIILRPFAKIWEEEFELCDAWEDLIEYVVQKFMLNFQTNGCLNTESLDRNSDGSQDQSNDAILTELSAPQSQAVDEDDKFSSVLSLDVESLKNMLVELGFEKQLNWIQSSLLVACSARLGTYEGQKFRNPIACLSLEMNVSCPIVPWTEVEACALRSKHFLVLLKRLSLLPHQAPNAYLYPRIPLEWSAHTLYSVALCFGPIDQHQVDFDLTRVRKVSLPIPSLIHAPGNAGFLPHACQSENLESEPATPAPHDLLFWVDDESGLWFSSTDMTSQEYNSSHSMSVHSHHPLLIDNMSSTSSLEVHKSDSSVIEETEGVVVNSSDRLVDSKTLARPSESVHMEITVRQDFSLANSDMGRENTNSGNDGPFEMTSIRCEISNILQ